MEGLAIGRVPEGLGFTQNHAGPLAWRQEEGAQVGLCGPEGDRGLSSAGSQMLQKERVTCLRLQRFQVVEGVRKGQREGKRGTQSQVGGNREEAERWGVGENGGAPPFTLLPWPTPHQSAFLIQCLRTDAGKGTEGLHLPESRASPGQPDGPQKPVGPVLVPLLSGVSLPWPTNAGDPA